jgi:hypothetical protein
MLSLLQYKQKIKRNTKLLETMLKKKRNLIKNPAENPEHAMDY